MGRIKTHFQSKFLAGALAAIPLAVTAFIFWYVDAQVRSIFEVRTPFVGVALGLVGIYVLGVFVTSLLGRYLLRFVDWLLGRLPGFRDLYQTWKQVAVAPDMDVGMFAQVMLIPDESGRARMLGFSTGRPIEGSDDSVCVFVPGSPNPLTGRLYFVRLDACLILPVGAKEALKFIVSAGNYIPPAIGAALAGKG